MKIKKNKVAEKCRDCGVRCNPGDGILYKDYQWYVKCQNCHNSPKQAEKQSPSEELFIGKELMVCGRKCVVVDKYLDDHTLLYTLYHSLDGEIGFIRLYDLDACEVVGLTGYPTSRATKEWSNLLAKVKQ